jgi:hypothetical protein
MGIGFFTIGDIQNCPREVGLQNQFEPIITFRITGFLERKTPQLGPLGKVNLNHFLRGPSE